MTRWSITKKKPCVSQRDKQTIILNDERPLFTNITPWTTSTVVARLCDRGVVELTEEYHFFFEKPFWKYFPFLKDLKGFFFKFIHPVEYNFLMQCPEQLAIFIHLRSGDGELWLVLSWCSGRGWRWTHFLTCLRVPSLFLWPGVGILQGRALHSYVP